MAIEVHRKRTIGEDKRERIPLKRNSQVGSGVVRVVEKGREDPDVGSRGTMLLGSKRVKGRR